MLPLSTPAVSAPGVRMLATWPVGTHSPEQRDPAFGCQTTKRGSWSMERGPKSLTRNPTVLGARLPQAHRETVLVTTVITTSPR
jgi:hypothetical protein